LKALIPVDGFYMGLMSPASRASKQKSEKNDAEYLLAPAGPAVPEGRLQFAATNGSLREK